MLDMELLFQHQNRDLRFYDLFESTSRKGRFSGEGLNHQQTLLEPSTIRFVGK